MHFQSRVERVVEYWAVLQKCDTNVVATANEGDVSVRDFTQRKSPGTDNFVGTGVTSNFLEVASSLR